MTGALMNRAARTGDRPITRSKDAYQILCRPVSCHRYLSVIPTIHAAIDRQT